jgi:hypothetical protein
MQGWSTVHQLDAGRCVRPNVRACSKSSKSLAAIFFISETFLEKRLIVMAPNVGIIRYLNINSAFESYELALADTGGRAH